MSVVYKRGRSEVCLYFDSSHSVDEIYQFAVDVEGMPRKEFYLTFNGKCLQSDEMIRSPCVVRFHLRAPGGKGGFGSMLRAIGARIEKTTNHEACRDLSGRRMRDVNNEKQIAEWMKKKESEESEREQKRVAKLEKILNPKHNYEDRDYTTNIQTNAENINDALKSALRKRDEKVNNKRKSDDSKDDATMQKNKRIWLGVGDDTDSDNSDAESLEGIISIGENPGCSKNMPTNERKIKGSVNKSCDTSSITLNRLEENKSTKNYPAENGGHVIHADTIAHLNTIDDKDTDDNVNTVLKDENISNRESAAEINAANVIDGEALSVDNLINLNDFNSPEHLESVGMDRLKTALVSIGLKCGGTLQERAYRLFATKNTPLGELDPSFFAKTSKGKGKHKK